MDHVCVNSLRGCPIWYVDQLCNPNFSVLMFWCGQRAFLPLHRRRQNKKGTARLFFPPFHLSPPTPPLLLVVLAKRRTLLSSSLAVSESLKYSSAIGQRPDSPRQTRSPTRNPAHSKKSQPFLVFEPRPSPLTTSKAAHDADTQRRLGLRRMRRRVRPFQPPPLHPLRSRPLRDMRRNNHREVLPASYPLMPVL